MILLFLAAAAATSCANAQTQADMNRCAGQDYARADGAMNRQWKTTYAYMKNRDARGGSFAAQLLDSQRAWLKYRDAQCIIAGAEFEGGSLQPMAVAQCRARLTDLRTKELQTLVWQR